MRRAILWVGAGLTLGCPAPSDPPVADGSTSEVTPIDSSTEPSATSSDTTTEDTSPSEPWLEVGWGTTEFNAFEDELPVVVGPQGLHMFSMPMRGEGFYNPPDPGFDNPDMPILQAWVDIEGYEVTPDGHFNEIVDYPALFYPSFDEPEIFEAPAVWLVLPDAVQPEQLEGATALLHAEMVDANGLLLVDDHELVIGEIPPGP